MQKILTIVVPCFNEEAVLPETVKVLGKILNNLIEEKKVAAKSKLLFVNDGSKDKTWTLISKYTKQYAYVTGLKFSRNYGQQSAVLAGMQLASKYSDLIITIDADLQDDVNAIPKMIAKYNEGYDVVYGVRNNRQTDSFFKRGTALAFYGLMRRLGVNLVPDSADYRLLSKRAVESLLTFKERNLFLRGLVPLIGYRSTKVYYARKERFAGSSKYSLPKMLHLALDGITSFSIAPLHLIMYSGLLIVAITLIWLIVALCRRSLSQIASVLLSIWLVGGIQLVALGVISEYIGKTNAEVKQRPRYIIETETYTEKMKDKQ